VAWSQCHVFDFTYIPSRNDQSPAIRIIANAIKYCFDLIMYAAIGAFPASPLGAVDWTKITVFIRPLIPDRDVSLAQPRDVGVATKKPQEFGDD
jgi:hypothetical protein